MRFRELTDEEWQRMRPHLPPPAKTGRPRADDRIHQEGPQQQVRPSVADVAHPSRAGPARCPALATLSRRSEGTRCKCYVDTGAKPRVGEQNAESSDTSVLAGPQARSLE